MCESPSSRKGRRDFRALPPQFNRQIAKFSTEAKATQAA